MNLVFHECQRTLFMISQHWFRQWHGTIMHKAITWADVDLDLCHHMASVGHNELRYWPLGKCHLQISSEFIQTSTFNLLMSSDTYMHQ